METSMIPILEVVNLKKYYPVKRGIISRNTQFIKALDGVSLKIFHGETVGLVGESGCGKSTLGRLLVQLEAPSEGCILFHGKDISKLSTDEKKDMKKKIQMVFQDPYSSLNPRKTIYEILSYPMMYHEICNKTNVRERVAKLLDLVGLPQDCMNRYPHEFSGGQKQRIGIARALSLEPELIVCDEPISALDVSIQAQILNLLRKLQKELGISYLFIGHGLDAVNYISNRINVMYLGKVVETGEAFRVFEEPIHPYTMALCNASPVADPHKRTEGKRLLSGEIPSNVNIPQGCRFHPRCNCSVPSCRMTEPELIRVESDILHEAACPIMLHAERSERDVKEVQECINTL